MLNSRQLSEYSRTIGVL